MVQTKRRHTVKHALNSHSQKDKKVVFKTNYRIMQLKSRMLQHFVILSTFIKLQIVIMIFVLSCSRTRVKQPLKNRQNKDLNDKW